MAILTNEQKTALRNFAKAHGRRWKSLLRTEWMYSACYSNLVDEYPIRHQIRNQFGPSWLDDLRPQDIAW